MTADKGSIFVDNNLVAANDRIVLAADQNIDVQQNAAAKNPVLSAKTTISATTENGYIKVGKDATAADAAKLVAEGDITLTRTLHFANPDGIDGITPVTTSKPSDDAVYSPTGHRLPVHAKGIRIRNGRKEIVR